jgi:hypothetical protein
MKESIMTEMYFTPESQNVKQPVVSGQPLSSNDVYLDGVEWGEIAAHSMGEHIPTHAEIAQDVLEAVRDMPEGATSFMDPGPLEWRIGWVNGYLTELQSLGVI